jgi:hypothetical protein
MRDLRKLVKWSIRVVKVVLLYRLCLIFFIPVPEDTCMGINEGNIVNQTQVVQLHSLRFLFEVDYGKT